MGRYFAKGWKKSWEEKNHKPRRKRRPKLIPFLLMVIGAVTVLALVFRFLIVPLLVFLGGKV